MATLLETPARFQFGRHAVCAVCGGVNPVGARCGRCATDARFAAALEALKALDDDDALDQAADAIERILRDQPVWRSVRPGWAGAVKTARDPIITTGGDGDDD